MSAAPVSLFAKEGIGAVDTDPDCALLARIARGDQKAIEQFHGRHYARVYRFALARVNDPVEADDIVNDVMLRVWIEAARFRGGSPVSTWLLGIAYHRAMDSLRSRRRHVAEPIDEQMPDESAIDMNLVLAREEDAHRVHAAMERLGEAHRTVLHLAFFEDLPYDRIAEILGCPEGTVKSRVFHAKQMIRRYLSE